ncbi:tetraacyldisaccharide 4'-kinase [Paradesertivirga mongoliensis]|uniref:Tetraacyldisaccharide 4'-kinase n=1 Tax=Paradesertivirga mongoliensis TaxID=2100740 RepID=A0ABW4ZGJ3_9SPHI|nr:tetraacyldisaccharide 4'-kinase [Pedobacter mongoliensis]
MQYLRLLLLPFSLIYGSVIWLRNKAYDFGIFKSASFQVKVISVGNLAIGGAGKSPMAEYLVRLLQNRFRMAVLSRGYGRKAVGFRLVDIEDTPDLVGDEPLQFRRKFDNITVAVAEKRVIGLTALQPNHDVVILDDAFQHRAVKPGLSILLFDYTQISNPLVVLPAGNLREPFANRKRAQILVVSKCPAEFSEAESEQVKNRIHPLSHQSLFFSYLNYGNLVSISSKPEKHLSAIEPRSTVFLLTGIANPVPLLKKVKSLSRDVIHHDYPDHHTFSTKNIAKLASEFRACPSDEKIIITTEKDAQRLQLPELLELLKDLPVYYLPVTARFHQADEARFNKLIELYVEGNI